MGQFSVSTIPGTGPTSSSLTTSISTFPFHEAQSKFWANFSDSSFVAYQCNPVYCTHASATLETQLTVDEIHDWCGGLAGINGPARDIIRYRPILSHETPRFPSAQDTLHLSSSVKHKSTSFPCGCWGCYLLLAVQRRCSYRA